jgi:hypothetical protein
LSSSIVSILLHTSWSHSLVSLEGLQPIKAQVAKGPDTGPFVPCGTIQQDTGLQGTLLPTIFSKYTTGDAVA